MHEALETATRFAKVGVQKHLIEIKNTFHPEALMVRIDRNKLVQVILNLLQNAAQAMPDGGVIQLKTKKQTVADRTFIEISVKDEGVGIPPENIKTIFDPFFTTKEPGEGTGLGLAICFGLIKEAGGEIEVESLVNVGTVFTIKLPCA